MINRFQHDGLTWIDIEDPEKDELRSLINEFSIREETAEELGLPSLKSKVDVYDSYIYLILHFPAIKHSHKRGKIQEVDFVLGKNFIITAHFDTIDSIHKFSKSFEVNSILKRNTLGSHAGSIFFFLLKKLYKSVIHELDFFGDKLQHIEHNIFKGNEREMVVDLSEVGLSLVDIKQSISLHREVLESFHHASITMFGQEFGNLAKSLLSEYVKVDRVLKNNMDLVAELRETNNSLLEYKQGETMKSLSMFALITFPLALVVAIFGLPNAPIITRPDGFWIVLGILGLCFGGMIMYFSHKKWI